ncbi:MAG: SMC-Scp complex subunit ScpB [Pirellulaceae bacterium]|nr:SMC-Scp complex subunit ScpB [Pirellulaceae bacterium]
MTTLAAFFRARQASSAYVRPLPFELRQPDVNPWRSRKASSLDKEHAQSSLNDPFRRLEAVLLLAREPLNSRKLSQYAGLADGTQARTLLRQLNESYDEAGRAFRVEEVAGGYQLLSRRKFGKWLRRLAHVPGESRLSAPALETLAVIAYRQPVPRADIEAIRGVNCGEILRQLMERDLVRIGGRSEQLGRPYLYATTRRFLNLFGLVSLDELPRAAELRSAPVTIGPPLVLEAAAADNESLENDPSESDAWEGVPPFGESDEVRYTGEGEWPINDEASAETAGEQELV